MKRVLIYKDNEIECLIGFMIHKNPKDRFTTTELLDYVKMVYSDPNINFGFDEVSLK